MMKTISLLSSLSFLAVGVLADPRTEPPPGAIVVAPEGGDFSSVQEAVDSIDPSSSDEATIFIQPGEYRGQVTVPSLSGKLVIYGYTEDDQDYGNNRVVVVHNLSAGEAGSNDASATLRALTSNFALYNVDLINEFGQGSQALAISGNGEYQGYYGCKFIGYQDTVYVNKPHHVFKNSYIEGATDFIFGNDGNAWFENCDIAINGRGYITASGRDSDDDYWYVINESNVAAAAGVSLDDGATVLGRPWREYARVVFQNTYLSEIVNPAGWSAWGDNPTDNVVYMEYGNTGPGASGERVSWATELSSPVSIGDILPDYTSWVDMGYWDQ